LREAASRFFFIFLFFYNKKNIATGSMMHPIAFERLVPVN